MGVQQMDPLPGAQYAVVPVQSCSTSPHVVIALSTDCIVPPLFGLPNLLPR